MWFGQSQFIFICMSVVHWDVRGRHGAITALGKYYGLRWTWMMWALWEHCKTLNQESEPLRSIGDSSTFSSPPHSSHWHSHSHSQTLPHPHPKDCAQFIVGFDEVASGLWSGWVGGTVCQWVGVSVGGRGDGFSGRWPAVCTAHITHSIESRPTLHTLFEITEALINSTESEQRSVGSKRRKFHRWRKWGGRGRGAFMEHVKLKCILR